MENESFIEEFKRYVANPKSRIAIIFAVIVFSVVSIVLVFTVINNKNTNGELEAAKKIEENTAEKAQILTQIVKNNPKGTVNPNTANPVTNPSITNSNTQDQFKGTSGYVEIDPATGLPVNLGNTVAIGQDEQPDLSVYNYRKSTETYTPGVISNVCDVYYSTLKKNRYITSEFFDPQNSYYSRKSEYVDGTLQGYFNSHNSPTGNETYSYAGGNYAVKQIYQPYWYSGSDTQVVPSYPMPSYPVSYMEIQYLISNYFGGSATIQRVYQQANRTFYEIRVNFRSYCNGYEVSPAIAPYVDSADNTVSIANIYTVDAKTFEITNTKAYLRDVNPSNLIYSRDYQVEYKLTAYEQVKSEFSTNFIADVKVVDWSSYTFSPTVYRSKIANYLKDNSISLILPKEDVSFAHFSAKNAEPDLPYANYFRDRNYYTPGANGDFTYQDIEKNYGPNNPLLIYGMKSNSGYSTYNIQQYEEGADYDKILADVRSYSPFGTTEYNKTFNIDNENVDVTLRQIVYAGSYYYPSSYPISYIKDLATKYPTISTLSYPSSFPVVPYYYVNMEAIFKYQGNIYRITFDGWALDRFLSEPFQNVNVGTADGFDIFSLAIANGAYSTAGTP